MEAVRGLLSRDERESRDRRYGLRIIYVDDDKSDESKKKKEGRLVTRRSRLSHCIYDTVGEYSQWLIVTEFSVNRFVF